LLVRRKSEYFYGISTEGPRSSPIEESGKFEPPAEVDEDAEVAEAETDEDEVSADDPSELR
jgi:hypothetical protein